MKYSFHVGVITETQTGRIISVYLRVRRGPAAKVRGLAGGAAFANYNRKGELLGVEILGPCTLRVLDSVANTAPEREFIRKSIPRNMVAAGKK